ncbi:MAG: FecR domain-containing protein [Nanoarchaeota archaeon]|nr:FecR domain-containing protein [Nanoarchaeota archaeon]
MSKGKGKKTGIIIGAVAGVIILIFIIGFFMITKSSTRIAFLNVESGDVQIDTGSGWQRASDGMKLSLNDKVKTGTDGEASVILYESAIVSLDPNTEVSIADLSKDTSSVEQETGTTWNKFTGLSGLKGLEVETPTAVATVRGTSFQVELDRILVREGNVEVTDKDGNNRIDVTGGMKAEMIDGIPTLKEMTPEEKAMLLDKMERHLSLLKELRQDEMDKHRFMVNRAKSMYKWTDEDIQRKIDKLDTGELDVDEIKEKAPIQTEVIDKFVALTKAIKKHKQTLDELRGASAETTETQ